MALILLGKTACTHCGKPLCESEELVAFPAFIPAGHELHAFNDAAFHKNCFSQWAHHDRMQDLFSRFQAVWKSRPIDASWEEIDSWGKSAFDDLFR